MTWYDEYFRHGDKLSGFVGIFVVLFTVLTLIYSVGCMRGLRGLGRYYACILLTCLFSLGAIFTNNLVLFMVFWGVLGLLLFLLIGFGEKERTSHTAKKAFIIIGGTDAMMLLGLAIVWNLAGQPGLAALNMDTLGLEFTGTAAVVAYLCLASGALAKAGAMPFHSWVPDTAEDAPTPVTAYLPASLDKLLGIYFLARISLSSFSMTPKMNTVLMAVGSVTIIAAVMMALVQHDLKRLLGYHAVSQVGYMVLGIGTGTAIGIAGGMFHMLNHAIYKSCLFFSGGAVEKQAGTSDLDRLGGFAKIMPITFTTFLIGSFAISGVPPFNGFASKWMVYQGVIQAGDEGVGLWIFWLLAAMFGSALTLASFMKLVHAVFLGQPSRDRDESAAAPTEVGPSMWIPTVVLAALCVVFGVFAYRIPLTYFIAPALDIEPSQLAELGRGQWQPVLATILLFAGLGIGLVIYLLGAVSKSRTVEPFVGGETLADHADMRMSGVDFYRTVQDIPFLGAVYEMAEKKFFDLYDVGRAGAFAFGRALGFLHNGALPRYLVWCLLGMLVLFYVLSGSQP